MAPDPPPDLLIVCIPATRNTLFGGGAHRSTLFPLGLHTAPHQGERGAGAAIAPGVRPRGGHKSGTESGRPNPVEITAAVERHFNVFGCLRDPRDPGISLRFGVFYTVNAYLLDNLLRITLI